MAMSIGLDCKLYRNSATYGSPTWVEVENVKDLVLNMSKGEADVSVRASDWRLTRFTLKDASVEFGMVWDPGDVDFEAFRDAFLNNTTIDCMVLSGAKHDANAEGLRAIFSVGQMNRDEPLEGPVLASFIMKPTYDTTNMDPVWMEGTTTTSA